MTSEDAIETTGQAMLLDDVVSTLVSVEKTIHQLEATRTALLAVAARIADDEAEDLTDVSSREMAHRAVATEIGAALHMSDRTVEAQMGDATMLTECFPATAAAFGAGSISKAHVRMILAAGLPIETAEGRAVFEEHVLPRAMKESVNRVRPYAKQIAERVRSTSFQQRHDEAKKRRQVWVTDEEDGESTLHMRGSTAIIHGIHDRLSQMAHLIKQENDRAARAASEPVDTDGPSGRGARSDRDDPEASDRNDPAASDQGDPSTGETGDRADVELDDRSMGELRSDLAADLLLTGVPTGHDSVDRLLSAIHAIVEITVPVITVTDPLDKAPPGHLAGIGPIDPETARSLARGAPGWDRVMTDPVTGAVLATDRYRPTSELRRHLRSRDRRCRFMGCNLTARKTDDDHDIDYALGGTTEEANLSGKCRRHHVVKHHTPWTVRHLRGAVLEWTSPTGRVYTDRPPGVPGHVTFDDVRRRVERPDLWTSDAAGDAEF